MSRRSPARSDAELAGRITSIDLARARLFGFDVDRQRRIDWDLAAERDPCGEAWLDEAGDS